jgi:hypothetical protein
MDCTVSLEFCYEAGPASQKKYVGALQDIAITWTVDYHTTVQLLGTYYEAGALVRETSPPGKNTAYVSGKVILQVLTVLAANRT